MAVSNKTTLPLASFYQGWETYQQQLIVALQPLTSDQLSLRAGPHLRSIRMIATHLLGVRAGWLYYVLNERDERLVELDQWRDQDQVMRTANELVDALQTTWHVLHAGLQRWTAEDLAIIFWNFDDNGEPEAPYSRQWILWHLLEHDLHHGGEISLTLGLHRLPAIEL